MGLAKGQTMPHYHHYDKLLRNCNLHRKSSINKLLSTVDLGKCNSKNVTKSKWFQESNKGYHLISEWEVKRVKTKFFV